MAVDVQQALTAHLIDVLKPLIDRQLLTDDGLSYLRGVLAAPGPYLTDDLRFRWFVYSVDVALAERMGIDVSLLPDWAGPPEDLPPQPSRW